MIVNGPCLSFLLFSMNGARFYFSHTRLEHVEQTLSLVYSKPVS